jgi:hypothetical protein
MRRTVGGGLWEETRSAAAAQGDAASIVAGATQGHPTAGVTGDELLSMVEASGAASEWQQLGSLPVSPVLQQACASASIPEVTAGKSIGQ